MPEPVSGRFDGGAHIFPVRVYYEDTDAGGIVYHANYLRFMERARTEMLRLLGFDQSVLTAESGVLFAVLRCEIDFVLPVKLDDRLKVVTRLAEIGPASFILTQDLQRNGTLTTRARVRLACLNTSGQPARLPAPVRTALTAFVALNPISPPAAPAPATSLPRD